MPVVKEFAVNENAEDVVAPVEFPDVNEFVVAVRVGTTEVSIAIVPEVVIVPPVRPVPAVILVTVPVPEPRRLVLAELLHDVKFK